MPAPPDDRPPTASTTISEKLASSPVKLNAAGSFSSNVEGRTRSPLDSLSPLPLSQPSQSGIVNQKSFLARGFQGSPKLNRSAW